MVTNHNFHTTNEKAWHAFWRANLFVFWVLGGAKDSFVVINVFPLSSHQVPTPFPSLPFPPIPHPPKKKPNVFPMATHFYPIYFAQSWTFIYINNEGKSKGSRDGPLYWGVPNVWKELLVMGQSKWLRPKTLKKKPPWKKPLGAHPLVWVVLLGSHNLLRWKSNTSLMSFFSYITQLVTSWWPSSIALFPNPCVGSLEGSFVLFTFLWGREGVLMHLVLSTLSVLWVRGVVMSFYLFLVKKVSRHLFHIIISRFFDIVQCCCCRLLCHVA